MTDENKIRNEFRAALRAVTEAEKRLRALSWELPDLPPDASEGTFEEIGYCRSERWDRETFDPDDFEEGETMPEPGPVNAYSRGWSSMSEDGSACWLEHDGLEYRIPDDINWD